MTASLLIGFVFLSIGSVFVTLAAAALWVRLRTGTRHLDAPLFLALWMFVVTLLVLSACALDALDARVLVTVCAVGSLALAWLFRRDLAVFAAACRSLRTLIAGFAVGRPTLAAVFALLAVTLALRTLAHAWLLPPYVWDTLVYHLPRIAEWIQRGGLFVFDTPIDRLYWPANFEIFQCWFVVFFHHDCIVELAGVFPYALCVLSVYSLGRSFGLAAPWAGGAAAIFSTTPALLQSAVTCKNDIAVAAWFLYMAATLADMAKLRRPVLTGARHVVLLGLAFGVALGTKPTIVFVAPGLVLLYVLLATSPEARAARTPGKPIDIGLAGSILACALFVGLFWYARNVVAFGNPFHPSPFRLFGHVIAGSATSPEYANSEFRPGDIAASLRLLPDKVFDRTGPLTPELPGAAGWGWFAVACGLPATAVLLFRPSPWRRLALSFALALVCLFGFVLCDAWNLRYALWFPALFPIAFALVTPTLRSATLRRAFVWLASLCCVGNVLSALNNGSLRPADWKRQWAIPILERSAAQMAGEKFSNVLRRVPRGETIGYDMHPNGWLYPLYGPDYAWRTLAFDDVRATPDLPQRMRQAKVRFIFCPYQGKQSKAWIKHWVVTGALRERGWGLYERVD